MTTITPPLTPELPAAAWTRPLGQPFENPSKPRVHSLIDGLINDGPYQGAPLGGIGAGSIGRTYRGDFARYQIEIGSHHYQPNPANMFSVYTEQDGQKEAVALFAGEIDGLRSWNWGYPVGAGTYAALYPRAWYTYTALPIGLTCEQFSPVIPHNYRESSYPVALFQWTAHNPTDAPITVSLMFTWQSWIGQDRWTGQVNQALTQTADGRAFTGVQMGHASLPVTDNWGGTLAILAEQVEGVTITTRTHWHANGDGSDVWENFSADGTLIDNAEAERSRPSHLGEVYGAAVAVKFTLEPGAALSAPFALAWDQPVMNFPIGIHLETRASWYKRYTAFWGQDGTNAFAIGMDGLMQRAGWRDQIIAWQRPILDDPARPTWYKTALFNELYYLADGGIAWEHGKVGDPPPRPDYLGHFLYLECFDYLHYATADVDFYASYALLELFPEIEKRLVRDLIEAIPVEDDEEVLFIGEKIIARRKLPGAAPHDLGGPYENPWVKINHYIYQDVNTWKDLNPKIVLRAYRDALLLNDMSLGADYYRVLLAAIDYLSAMDSDDDGIPDNDGADQTYDMWPAYGVSAYSGGLWIAALHAMREIALFVGDVVTSKAYRGKIEKATKTYQARLWNGQYFLYDTSGDNWHDSIMADQLCGQWAADFMGIEVLPRDQVKTVLETVYAFNVCQFGDGQIGAVNGMRPDGSIDTSSKQSEEMWSGVTYALASFMLMRGMDEQAWATAYGVYKQTYETGGMWFRTPEAFDVEGNYRASEYLRPLAIWAIETALRTRPPR
ncbi:MAG: non-lysosomal glucosylceramidase [bacterium]|nr:non-lysosomal glucosylceramidase [bacterium]